MMNLTRLWELISGRPHLHHNAALVANAAASLSKRAHEFEMAVKPYSESNDPLVMFMTDIFNRRAEMRDKNAEFRT